MAKEALHTLFTRLREAEKKLVEVEADAEAAHFRARNIIHQLSSALWDARRWTFHSNVAQAVKDYRIRQIDNALNQVETENEESDDAESCDYEANRCGSCGGPLEFPGEPSPDQARSGGQ